MQNANHGTRPLGTIYQVEVAMNVAGVSIPLPREEVPLTYARFGLRDRTTTGVMALICILLFKELGWGIYYAHRDWWHLTGIIMGPAHPLARLLAIWHFIRIPL